MKAQTMTRIASCIFLVAALFFSSQPAHAVETAPEANSPPKPAIELGTLFCDNMVLQRGKPVKVWGWADRGEAISVEFHDQKVQTKADDQGTWAAELGPMEATEVPAPACRFAEPPTRGTAPLRCE